ncbi:hypothetical protein KC351_g3728 [Hortaea werneckii]|nr:hypothetical protein KC351_g3728 [Hortaea werneckii]
MSAEGSVPVDVFHKYCAELSVPRLITTWSIEMSKQQLMNILSNRGYRFDLHQFSTDQLLQLLRESDILCDQVRKDGTDPKGESNTTAGILNEKGNNSEQHTQRPGPGAPEMQVQPESNISSPRDSPEDELVSAEREGEDTFQYRPDPAERHGAAERGKRKSDPDEEVQFESNTEHEKKKQKGETGFDQEFKQRVEDLRSRLTLLAN